MNSETVYIGRGLRCENENNCNINIKTSQQYYYDFRTCPVRLQVIDKQKYY